MTIINRIHRYRKAEWYQRNESEITYIVIHHSASTMRDDEDNMLREHGDYHMNVNKWQGLSYHYIIGKSGKIYKINNLSDITWTDGINKESLSICLDGYFHPDINEQPTPAQLQSLQWLIDELRSDNYPSFGVAQDRVVAHREHSATATACCGDLLYGYIVDYRNNGKIITQIITNTSKLMLSTPHLKDTATEELIAAPIWKELDQTDRNAFIGAGNNHKPNYIYIATILMALRHDANTKQLEINSLKKVTPVTIEKEIFVDRSETLEKLKQTEIALQKQVSINSNSQPAIEHFSIQKYFVGMSKNGVLYGLMLGLLLYALNYIGFDLYSAQEVLGQL